MLGHTGFRRLWGHRLWKRSLWKRSRRGLLAVVGTVLALSGIAIALAPPPSSQAAQGQKWTTGVPYAGVLTTNTDLCSVTVVSEWLAITAKHCGTVNPTLKLNVADTSSPGAPYPVDSIQPNNRGLDVQALFLKDRTGLSVTPLRASVDRNWFYGWGYGRDWSNNATHHLTRAAFNLPNLCPKNLNASRGNLCWQTTATNSMCSGDSGGPVTQNGAIIGMVTAGSSSALKPNGQPDCSTTYRGRAITIQQMQPWLDQMIAAADPFP